MATDRDLRGVHRVRTSVLAVCATLICGGAAAETWQEYVYGQYGFAVSFPGTPKSENLQYRLPDGSSVPARVYSVTQADGDYRVTIADFSSRPESENTILDDAEINLKRTGNVKVELPARVQAVFGRQLSLNLRDGSHISAALFIYQHRLYQIAATASPPAAMAGSSDAIRFQQSLRFTGNTAGFLGLNFLFGALRRF